MAKMGQQFPELDEECLVLLDLDIITSYLGLLINLDQLVYLSDCGDEVGNVEG